VGLLGSATLGAAEPSSSALTLSCEVVQTVTGTHGSVRKVNRTEIIKLGPGVYRVWSPGVGWGENHCAFTPCPFTGTSFSYRIDSSTSRGGYVLRHFEVVAFERASGLLDAEEENSTTAEVTGIEKETTIYEHGHCKAAADPAA
ncbi:MAG TPA: hypothetical protein VME40_12475, partial [Caulobacteraceae bacterium]|nr:hypothetical protein [Caulobacteraceae bacterium]